MAKRKTLKEATDLLQDVVKKSDDVDLCDEGKALISKIRKFCGMEPKSKTIYLQGVFFNSVVFDDEDEFIDNFELIVVDKRNSKKYFGDYDYIDNVEEED